MSIRKSISFTFGSQIINTVVSFISSIFITRILGAEGRGEYAIYTNALAMVSIWLGFSLSSSIIYFASGNKMDGGRMFTTMVWVCIGTVLLLLLTLSGLFFFGGQQLIFPDQYQSHFWQVLFVIQFFISQLNSIIIGFLNAYRIFIPQAIFSIILSILTLVVWLSIYYNLIPVHQQGFSLVITVLLILTLPQLINNFVLLKKRTGILFTFKLLKWNEIKQMINFALLIYGCHTLQFLNYKMDLWIVDHYHGKSETGIYSLSVTLAQLIWLLPNAMAGVLYSIISVSSIKHSIEMTIKYARWAFYASFLLAIIGYLVLYFAIPVVYGEGFIKARLYIAYLLIGIVPFSISIIFGSFVAGTKKLLANFKLTVISTAVTTVLYFVLIPRYGAVGAALATSLSYICSVVILLLYLYYFFDIRKITIFDIPTFISDYKLLKMVIKKRYGRLKQKLYE